ncbi:MAG: nucleoside-diphosphate-sugar epimerase [Deltaproteobacteria bacterium HGW-Deltaproteobacteria-15]|jgi:dTDP-L-rhamnose 4-epimerase|nr:MAG: nucleoside-diphosphate-sugar epimerase [Deltaproteobacteria bacterium HGW-Deltaproteobacteria-15]
MVKAHVLVTGGAGFIGSHLVDDLLRCGHRVRILDNLTSQVHPRGEVPVYLNREAEFIKGDVRNPEDVRRALDGIDAVIHLAAAVGVGQSMYQVQDYTSVNNFGTAVLLQKLINRPVGKLVVASSMSIYGEGLYRSEDGSFFADAKRSLEQLTAGRWEIYQGNGAPLVPLPTPESKKPSLSSIYALTKYDQEQMCLLIGRAYGISTVALRFFNVYGARQALSNPYTGVLAIFASRYLNNKPPLVYEDGMQKRDFVSVHDVASACRLALECPDAAGFRINIGSGRPYTISEVAKEIGRVLHKEHVMPQITGKYRMGDIRHCFADISLARSVLGYSPKVDFGEGLEALSVWLVQQSAEDYLERAALELQSRGLTIG